MAYIGQGIKNGTFAKLDTSGNTYNGSNVTFDLGTQVGSPVQLLVSHDGVIQNPGTDYTLASNGTQITFTTAPASGASIFIMEISGAVGGPMNRDLNGEELILDVDGDTSITADTDDQIDIKVGGTDVATLTNSNLVLKGTTPTLTIGDAGAEDTKIVFDGNAQDFHIGLDDSADDLVIGLGSTLGTTSHIVIDETGAVTKPLQPSFLVSPSGTLSNVTGDNTNYDVVFATEVIDRNADFSSATFTAPVTGIYAFHAILEVEGVTDSHTQCVAFFNASNRTYYIKNDDGGNYHASGGLYMNFSGIIDMDANDTVTLQLDFRNGSKVVDVGSGSYWGGYLVA
jgi:hypothetical protein